MYIHQKYFFYRCYNCGEWYYTHRVIKKKKCWKCNHTFSFENSTKFSKICTTKGAITIIKELKTKP
ncbi:MAG: DUF1922 domain-containing protein [Candidatus Heimdallarchaeota archaeon]